MKDPITNIIVDDYEYFLAAPQKCPMCGGKALHDEVYQSTIAMSTLDYPIHYRIYECRSCCRPFIATWEVHSSKKILSTKHIAPYIYLPVDFGEDITNLSPNFANIYNEAREAEERGLLLICGAGYRRALEFLVKDFLISQSPEKHLEIEKKTLYACIEDLPDALVQRTAHKIRSIGNDFTHYKTQYTKQDVSELKDLIQALVYWLKCLQISMK